jgi:hypothetical protein
MAKQQAGSQPTHWALYCGWYFGAAVIVGCLAIVELAPNHGWKWVVGLLPAALVAQHAGYLINVKREAATAQLQELPPKVGRLKLAWRRLQMASKLYFDRQQLTIQYSTLTTLLAIVGVALVLACCDPPACLRQRLPKDEQASGSTIVRGSDDAARTTSSQKAPSSIPKSTAPAEKPAAEGDQSLAEAARHDFVRVEDDVYLGAMRLGAAGAFIYVLIYLGRRNFQRDITSGTAIWSAVQLILGPTLAFTIAYFLTPSRKGDSNVVGIGAVYFLAGLSPRVVADWISDSAQRAWLIPRAALGVSRAIPLGQVRGITPGIEGRLNEEGIEDAADLAMANPVKLFRNTPFDPRQILSWIDESILIMTLPQHWEALEKEGITGAIDLACISWTTSRMPTRMMKKKKKKKRTRTRVRPKKSQGMSQGVTSLSR